MDLNVASISKRPATGADKNHVKSALKGEVVMDKRNQEGQRLPSFYVDLYLAHDKITNIINAAYSHKNIQLLDEDSEEEKEKFRKFLEALKAPYDADVKFMHPDRLRLLVAAYKNMILEENDSEDPEQHNEVHYKAPHGDIVVTPQEITWRPRPLITRNGQKVLRHAFNERDAAALALAAMFDETLAPPNQMIIHGSRKQQRMIMYFINRFNELMPEDDKRIVAPEIKKVLFFDVSAKPNGFGQWAFDHSQRTLGVFNGPSDHEYNRLFAHERTLISPKSVPPSDVPLSVLKEMDNAQPVNHFIPNMRPANSNLDAYSIGDAMNEFERLVTGNRPKVIDPTEIVDIIPDDEIPPHEREYSPYQIGQLVPPNDSLGIEMSFVVNEAVRKKEELRENLLKAEFDQNCNTDSIASEVIEAARALKPWVPDNIEGNVSYGDIADQQVYLTGEDTLRSMVDEWTMPMDQVADLVIQKTAEDILAEMEIAGLEELAEEEAAANAQLAADAAIAPAKAFETASSPETQPADGTPASAAEVPASGGFTPYDVYKLIRNYVVSNKDILLGQPVSALNNLLLAIPGANYVTEDPASGFAAMLENHNMAELEDDGQGNKIFKSIPTFKPDTDLFNTIALNMVSAPSTWIGKDVQEIEKTIMGLCGHDFGGYANAAAIKIRTGLQEQGIIRLDENEKIKNVAAELLGVPLIEKAFGNASYLEFKPSDEVDIEFEENVDRDCHVSVGKALSSAVIRSLDLQAA